MSYVKHDVANLNAQYAIYVLTYEWIYPLIATMHLIILEDTAQSRRFCIIWLLTHFSFGFILFSVAGGLRPFFFFLFAIFLLFI